MDQYHPCYRADDYRELSRALTQQEHSEVLAMANRVGLNRLDGYRSRSCSY